MRRVRVQTTREENVVEELPQIDRLIKELKKHFMKPMKERESFDESYLYERTVALERDLDKTYKYVNE